MDVDIDHRVWLRGHTTADISDVSIAASYISEVAALFGTTDLDIVWFDEVRNRETRMSQASVSLERLTELYRRGVISLESRIDDNFVGEIEWRRVPPQEHARFLKTVGYVQNEVSLDICAHEFKRHEFRESFADFCVHVSRLFDVNYLYASNPRMAKQYNTMSGLGVGVHQIHWINVFGPAYVSIIGRERLLSAPAYMVREIDSSRIMLQVADQISNLAEGCFPDLCRRIQRHIGDEFFTKQYSPDLPEAKVESGVRSFWKGIWSLQKSRRAWLSDAGAAERRPEFNWEQILVKSSESHNRTGSWRGCV